MEPGKKVWIFADGDLPPQGAEEPFGHEALVIVNVGDFDADLDIELLFSESNPVTGIKLAVPAKRVQCFRLDYPIGNNGYKIPFGQYALVLRSNVPVVK